jgi:glycosyltransferase involved in cell wall biosynthesis
MMKTNRKIAVLIPCYNEAITIEKVVRDFKAALPDATVYVYDNNSTDGSDELAKKAGAIVGYESRQGKGNVVRTMFREIDADCYVLTDADDAFPADIAPAMVDMVLSQGYDMIIGDRLSTTYADENKRAFHGFGNNLVRNLVNVIFKGNVQDILSGYRVLSKAFVKTFPVLSPGFELETEMTIHALDNRFKMKSVPVKFTDRPAGSESKLNTFSDGLKVILKIFNTFKDYKPLPFFGIISALLIIFALVLFIPVFIAYLETSLVGRMPTLVVSVFLMLAALQSFVCGLILDTEARRNKQNFEVQLNLLLMLADVEDRSRESSMWESRRKDARG